MREKSKLLSILFEHKGRVWKNMKKDGIAETLTEKPEIVVDTSL